MNGMDAETGKALGGLDHLRQSVRVILTTPVGTRTFNREFGSRLMALIDAPLNKQILTQIYAATVEAIDRWEPRLKIDKVQAVSARPGEIVLDISGTYKPTGAAVVIDGLVVN